MYLGLVALKYHQLMVSADFKYRVIMYPGFWMLQIDRLTDYRSTIKQLEVLA